MGCGGRWVVCAFLRESTSISLQVWRGGHSVPWLSLGHGQTSTHTPRAHRKNSKTWAFGHADDAQSIRRSLGRAHDEIDWLTKEGGRWVVRMTQRPAPKRLSVFTEEGVKNGKTKHSVSSQRKTWALAHQQRPVPQSSGHSCTPVGRRRAPIRRSLGRPHDPTPALGAARENKMPETPSSMGS